MAIASENQFDVSSLAHSHPELAHSYSDFVETRDRLQPVEPIVSAICYTLLAEWKHEKDVAGAVSPNAVANFVLAQQSQMASWLRVPLQAATEIFDFSAFTRFGGRFHRLPVSQRLVHLSAWRESSLGVQRDLVRFYESLVAVAADSPELRDPGFSNGTLIKNRAADIDANDGTKWTDIVVIGSGPGGAVTACLLAEAGREVTLIEEGANLSADVPEQFSLGEMFKKYRNGGVTAIMGNPKIAYVEGKCVGGGSEVNSGLYHRTPSELLDQWRRDFEVEAIDEASLRPHFESCERDLSVSCMPTAAPVASRRLHEGARSLGWKSSEIPRWFDYNNRRGGNAGPGGVRQTMSRTFVPRALAAGCKLLSKTRVTRLRRHQGGWKIETIDPSGRPSYLLASTVFVACGAIQTPALLQRSGLGSHAGRSLHVHPTVKLVAEFDEPVNLPGAGVGVHQVKEFSPRLSFGCSVSSMPHLRLAMLDHASQRSRLEQCWPNMAIYYAMITGGHGSVRAIPGLRDPLVRFRLDENNLRDLADGLRKLSQQLFEAGAIGIFPAFRGAPVLHNPQELSAIANSLSRSATNLMTIHLFSSCPMGEDRKRCTADSFGKVHGEKNLYLADASLLCTAPGVNPQGSIMAFARRNALHFLGR